MIPNNCWSYLSKSKSFCPFFSSRLKDCFPLARKEIVVYIINQLESVFYLKFNAKRAGMEPFYGRSFCLKSLALGSTRLAWPSYINWANQDVSQGSNTQLNCWSFTRWPDSFQPPRRCQPLWPFSERCLPRRRTSVGHCTWIALGMVSGSCHGTQRTGHYPVCHTAA